MPQIVPSGLGAAAQSSAIQMDAMGAMQGISRNAQAFDEANRQIQEDQAIGEMNSLMAQETIQLAAAKRAGTLEEFSIGAEQRLSDTITGLAPRMGAEGGEALLLGAQGFIQDIQRKKAETALANRVQRLVGSEDIDEALAGSVQELADAGEFEQAEVLLNNVLRTNAERQREEMNINGLIASMTPQPGSSGESDFLYEAELLRTGNQTRSQFRRNVSRKQNTRRVVEDGAESLYDSLARQVEDVEAAYRNNPEQGDAIILALQERTERLIQGLTDRGATSDGGEGQAGPQAPASLADATTPEEASLFLSTLDAEGRKAALRAEKVRKAQAKVDSFNESVIPGLSRDKAKSDLREARTTERTAERGMIADASLSQAGIQGNSITLGPASFVVAYEQARDKGDKKLVKSLLEFLSEAGPQFDEIKGRVKRKRVKSVGGSVGSIDTLGGRSLPAASKRHDVAIPWPQLYENLWKTPDDLQAAYEAEASR